MLSHIGTDQTDLDFKYIFFLTSVITYIEIVIYDEINMQK
jgi:hypothetical protein